MENSTPIDPKNMGTEIPHAPDADVDPKVAAVDQVNTQDDVDRAHPAVESPQDIPADLSPPSALELTENSEPTSAVPTASIPAGALLSRPSNGVPVDTVPTPDDPPASSELGEGTPAAPPA